MLGRPGLVVVVAAVILEDAIIKLTHNHVCALILCIRVLPRVTGTEGFD